MKTPLQALRSLARKAINTVGIDVGRPPAEPVPRRVEDTIAALDPRFRSPLLSMYRREPQIGTDGQQHDIDKLTNISPSQGMWLYDLCVSAKPKATIEIGMAYGYSTLYFLAAIAKRQEGHHTAIDPFQRSNWHGIGLTHARALAPIKGSGSAFRFIEDRSDRTATDLARSNSTFEVIFIDGNHRFDDVLVDFYLYAPLCAIGGHIVLDDMWLSSIKTVAAFVRANRADFIEVSTTQPNIVVLRRVGDDSRLWSDFHEFAVFPGTRQGTN